jgi:hypothetical protein
MDKKNEILEFHCESKAVEDEENRTVEIDDYTFVGLNRFTETSVYKNGIVRELDENGNKLNIEEQGLFVRNGDNLYKLMNNRGLEKARDTGIGVVLFDDYSKNYTKYLKDLHDEEYKALSPDLKKTYLTAVREYDDKKLDDYCKLVSPEAINNLYNVEKDEFDILYKKTMLKPMMEVPHEKPENPKEIFQHLLDIKEVKITQKDLLQVNNYLDKRASENNLPTFVELQNLSIRAQAKFELEKDRQDFLQQTKKDIKTFTEDNGAFFSKRQYGDIMKRAEKSMSASEVKQDLYKVLQVNNMTNLFSKQLKDSGIPVSSRFCDQIAQRIERSQLSMDSVQNLMENTIKHIQEQDFKIDKLNRDTEKSPHSFTDSKIDGTTVGSVFAMENEEVGLISVSILDKSNEQKEIFSIQRNTERLYETETGKTMSKEEAVSFAEKSLTKAINTDRVLEVFRLETEAYASTIVEINNKTISHVRQQDFSIIYNSRNSNEKIINDKEESQEQKQKDIEL